LRRYADSIGVEEIGIWQELVFRPGSGTVLSLRGIILLVKLIVAK
jgi:hypothetical protein